MSSADTVAIPVRAAREGGPDWSQMGRTLMSRLAYPVIGILALLAVWWLGGWKVYPFAPVALMPWSFQKY